MTNTTNEFVENFVFDEIQIGQVGTLVRNLTIQEIFEFAAVSGDTNPAHLDKEFANSTSYHEIIGHGMWEGALISRVLGTIFPGYGTIYLDQSLHFIEPVKVGDTVTVTLIVREKFSENYAVLLDCVLTNQKGEKLLNGTAKVIAPTEKIRRKKISVPKVKLFNPELRLQNLIQLGADLEPIVCGVVHACDDGSMRGAIDSATRGIIKPIFIGPKKKLLDVAEKYGLDLTPYQIVDVPHSHAAAEMAALLASECKVEALMKGSLHTDELMHAVIANKALRTKRRLSHIFRFEVPLYDKPILISDAALNIRPSLLEKADIVQNAIDFSQIMGVDVPKVAILSAVETINQDIPSTLDAAALCKMAQRGQIRGGELDGPLAFDNAISPEAVRIKHIQSGIGGNADILIVPDLESGNMLSKQLEYLAGASGCGVVLGCKVPIALTSRADGPNARIASALLSKMIAHHNRKNKP